VVRVIAGPLVAAGRGSGIEKAGKMALFEIFFGLNIAAKR